MSTSHHANEPTLAPPGAGLPWLELQIARWMFLRGLRRATPEGTRALLEQNRDAALALVQQLSPEQASRRVLIPRPRGLEDSSRYWSVYMTLEHLRLVNMAVAGAIRNLGRGVVPAGAASTAGVKPASDQCGAHSPADFAQSCEIVLKAAAAVPDLHTAARYRHPWFGELDAAGWYLLAAVHIGLHEEQLRRIMKAL